MFLLLSAIAFGGAVFLWVPPVHAHASKQIQRFERHMLEVLSELFIFDTTPRVATCMIGGLTAFLVLVLGISMGWVFGLPVGLAGGVLIPWVTLRVMVNRRRTKLEAQLMDGLITLANGVRAGLNLPQSLRLIEEHSRNPLAQEFGLILREVEHGSSLDVAMGNSSHRIKSHNFQLLFAALKTTRMRGGNIPETLDRLGDSLREITRLDEKIKAQTAQGKMSAVLMAFMPVVVLGIYWLIDPEGVRLLFSDSYGQAVLAVVVFLDLIGFFWIRAIVTLEY